MAENIGPPIESKKAREFIDHVKAHTDQLVDEGVDRKLLTDRLASLDKALNEKAHASVIGHMLSELKGAFEQTAGSSTVTGLIILLNEIFATGVPSPDRKADAR
jgi:hypothetical protein